MNRQSTIIFISLISLNTACHAMTEDQQRAAWAAMRKAEGGIEHPSHSFAHALSVQPHKQALDNARKIFTNLGLTPPCMFTTFEGMTIGERARHRESLTLASADSSTGCVRLSPNLVKLLTSADPADQAYVEHVLLHEYTHLAEEDSSISPIISSWGLPPYMQDKLTFNSRRRGEFRADREGYKKMSTDKLLLEKARLEKKENLIMVFISRISSPKYEGKPRYD